MGVIVAFGAMLIALGLALGDRYVAYAGIVFISGQALLAYFVAGASKLTSIVWRSGSAVSGVMQTVTFGNAWAARLMLASPIVSFGVGWLVMGTEVLFPIAFIAPPLILAVILIGFAIFHLSNAIFMGLNSFVLSFVATYPAVWLINTDIRSYLAP
ncbi:hypothetical protein HJC02_23940 [Rhizobium sp. NLR4a]|uniref:hypothetical protein n=1 Tax=Rhizobium sp. NLR4a TaxID=2731117 RepID=UPI001C83C560|nr:hypothetical protein [Rhizobium sp. NLR4a]MBX5235290.1 hypothetical protein [Rhizobium sp. NLR4a]